MSFFGRPDFRAHLWGAQRYCVRCGLSMEQFTDARPSASCIHADNVVSIMNQLAQRFNDRQVGEALLARQLFSPLRRRPILITDNDLDSA